MERLTPLSYAFLAAEDVDPTACLVIGSLAVLDGPAPHVDELRTVVAARLPTVPRYQQRVVPDRFGLRAPSWQDDPDVDLRRHVTRRRVPAPGGRAEVASLIAEAMAERMDRDRPLWDVTVCVGLADGRWGLLSRVHHALADGVSGTGLYRVVFDSEAAPDQPPPTPPGTAPGVTGGSLRAAARGVLALGTALLPVTRAGLLGPLDGTRRYAWTEVGIAETEGVRRELGVTVNDLVLAAISGGLRELLLERGRQPDAHALRTLLPVSARAPGTAGLPGNEVTLMLSMLPVELDDPVERVLQVHERVAGLRRAHEPEAGVVLQALAGLLPFPVLDRGLRWGLRLPQQQVSTVTTNVPGPRTPLTCLGRPVRQLLPVVPIADRVRLGFAVLSYGDRLAFGITADGSSTPDVDVLASKVAEAWRSLLARPEQPPPAGLERRSRSSRPGRPGT
ncbi:wax ester/triacylglycerol synthase family O-acyltransferase [Nocardioides ganghwensis]|jgi:WS/DGAT/MGAT family acyltransferase|uniref:Diacylglycerol O-acyltransferase n=1 Tax=Nocardioides ganghwensis TaxID=252230 RepID=A0A4Q2S7K6_9ACTN|nr:wax ester/triacylglycerol synthase family O-acyltransferase [Nocardioides ganghwensis]MBD3945157.1 wax ester/triacylglycerol synthase family O-acyltransferase [Nocardioides ganghwensis]RYB98648.1 wax ester/triacylglycerol synthase family O-acyltransferase [Nocardioides ganghwensis]